MTALDDVARELANLKKYLRIAVGTVVVGVIFNVLALVLYYLHITTPAFVITRVVIGVVGIILVTKAYQSIKRLEIKYKAP
jgi:xanthosine utilization system XapX-like protein